MGRKKSDRTALIEACFCDDPVVQGDQTLFKCLVGDCGEMVADVVGRETPGRWSHLERNHSDKAKEMPQKNAMKAPTKKKEQNQQPEEKGQEDVEQARKKKRTETADLFARNLFPFLVADDPFFEGFTRKNIVEALEARLEEVKTHFFEAHKNEMCSISIDGGTNAGTRTLNICILHSGCSRLLAAERLEHHTSEAIVESVTNVLKQVSLTIAAFTSDNAANVRSANATRAKNHKALSVTCACHSLNIFVRRMVYEWESVDCARKIASSIRDLGEAVPVEIDTRWTAAFCAIDYVHSHRAKLLLEKKVNHADLEKIKAGWDALQPFYFATLRCEKLQATVYDTVEELGSCLAIFDKQSANDRARFQEIFERNVYSWAVVAACATSLHWNPSSAIPPIRMMAEEALTDLCDDLCEKSGT